MFNYCFVYILITSLLAPLAYYSCISSSKTKNTEENKIKDSDIIGDSLKEFKIYFPEVEIPDRPLVVFKDKSTTVRDPGLRKKRQSHANCDYDWTNFNHVVAINKNWWTVESNEWYKKKVIMHEFGHCLLYLKHTDDLLEYSLMNTTLTTVNPDGSNWGYLMGELRMRYLKGLAGDGEIMYDKGRE